MINRTVQIYDYNDNLIEVNLFQLLQWKHALRLEERGMRFSRGSVTAHVRKVLSAPRSYKGLAQHIAASLESIMEELGETE